MVSESIPPEGKIHICHGSRPYIECTEIRDTQESSHQHTQIGYRFAGENQALTYEEQSSPISIGQRREQGHDHKYECNRPNRLDRLLETCGMPSKQKYTTEQNPQTDLADGEKHLDTEQENEQQLASSIEQIHDTTSGDERTGSHTLSLRSFTTPLSIV